MSEQREWRVVNEDGVMRMTPDFNTHHDLYDNALELWYESKAAFPNSTWRIESRTVGEWEREDDGETKA